MEDSITIKLYTHPKFIDVHMGVYKAFYIKEKREWDLKVQWFHKTGRALHSIPYRLNLSNEKWLEFTKVREEFR